MTQPASASINANPPALWQRVAAEAIGAGTQVAAVVGSGIMAARLSSDVLLQLLVNAAATVAVLGVLIAVLSPVSGAHLNPAVTVVEALHLRLPAGDAGAYVAAQLAGELAGVGLANLMFDLPALQASTHQRSGLGLWLGEVVASAGLLLIITALARTGRSRLAAVLVPAWIGGAYFFTSSTSFANPAVTVARAFSDTFAGIAPASLPAFITAQAVGAVAGVGLAKLLFAQPISTTISTPLPMTLDHSETADDHPLTPPTNPTQ